MNPVAITIITISALAVSLIIAILVGRIIKAGRQTSNLVDELDGMRRGEARFSDPRSCREM